MHLRKLGSQGGERWPITDNQFGTGTVGGKKCLDIFSTATLPT
jgi:hypothetical protein